MGVRGLETYMKVKKFYREIRILEEIKKLKKYNPSTEPLIVFDMMGVIHAFKHNPTENICGGRHHIYLREIEQFFKTLTDHGCRLAFFCDGQLRTEKMELWISRRERMFREHEKILDQIARRENLENATADMCKGVVRSILKIAKRYGDVIISTNFDCDAVIAQHALRNNALAVLTTDTDNLIFEGNWQYWHASSINFKKLTVNTFSRKALTDHLNLTQVQMKLLAAMCGNDYTKNLISFGRFCRPNERIENIANVIRNLGIVGDSDDALYRTIGDISRIWFKPRLHKKDIATLRQAVKSYDVSFVLPQTDDVFHKYVIENVLMHSILNDGIFQYEMNWVDLPKAGINSNSVQSFTEIILPVFRRLSGILLKNETSRDSFRIVIKHHSDKPYVLSEEKSIYPEEDFPSIQRLILEDDSHESIKWKLLLWSLSIDEVNVKDLRRVQSKHILVVLTIMFMVQMELITVREADAFLVTEFEVNRKSIADDIQITNPQGLNDKTVRVAQLYNKVIALVSDCLTICGLEEFNVTFGFDGIYFHNLVDIYSTSNSDYISDIEKIKEMRL